MEPTSTLTITHNNTEIILTETQHPLHGPFTEQHPNPEPTPPQHSIRLNQHQALTVQSYITAWLNN